MNAEVRFTCFLVQQKHPDKLRFASTVTHPSEFFSFTGKKYKNRNTLYAVKIGVLQIEKTNKQTNRKSGRFSKGYQRMQHQLLMHLDKCSDRENMCCLHIHEKAAIWICLGNKRRQSKPNLEGCATFPTVKYCLIKPLKTLIQNGKMTCFALHLRSPLVIDVKRGKNPSKALSLGLLHSCDVTLKSAWKDPTPILVEQIGAIVCSSPCSQKNIRFFSFPKWGKYLFHRVILTVKWEVYEKPLARSQQLEGLVEQLIVIFPSHFCGEAQGCVPEAHCLIPDMAPAV